MARENKGLKALLCCLVCGCSCVQAAEGLGLAWKKGLSLQYAIIAAVVGDPSGCTLVTGDTAGDFGPGVPNRGQRDAFLTKYTPDGDVMWICPLGTDRLDTASCLTVDALGNCYVGGQTNGLLGPNPMGDTGETEEDAFVAKISPAGSCVWIRQFGSVLPDGARRVRLDRDGNCYVAGNTTCCTLREVSDGGGGGRRGGGEVTTEEVLRECPFVAKLDAKGELVWFNAVQESYANTGLGVGVDPNGTVALTGRPGYVATFDANGIPLETHPLEHQSLRIMDACVDDLGHVYLVGETGWASRVIQYDLEGRELWTSRFQKNGWCNTKSIVLCPDGSHDLVTAGCQGGPSGGGSCQTFIRRYSQSGNLVSLFGSEEGYCGAWAGGDCLQGAYALSSLQGTGVISTLFKAQSPLTITASHYLEAENADFQGAMLETSLPNYSGPGYIALSGSDCSVKWKINFLYTGTRTAYLRYLNPNPESIFALPRLNNISSGRKKVTVEFLPTGDQDGWSTVRYDLNLQAGSNTFKIVPEADSIQQGLYLDTLEMVTPGANVALGKSWVCSEGDQINPAAVFDGKLNTAWQVQTYPQWIEIDLSHTYPVDQSVLFCEGAGSRQFIVEAKATLDDPYQLLVDSSSNMIPVNLNKPMKATFPTTDLRYVRFTVTGEAEHSVNIYEFCLRAASIVP